MMIEEIFLQLLLMIILLGVTNGNLCNDTVRNSTHDITTKFGLTTRIPGPGASVEYTFEADQPTKFVNIACSPVFNANDAKDDFSKILIETHLNGQVYVSDFLCKRTSSPERISSMGKIRVGLCSGNVKEPLQLSATLAECNAVLRVTASENTVGLGKSSDTCSISLSSLQGGGIEATISEINTRNTKSSRCKGAFIAAKSTGDEGIEIEQPILLDGKVRICKTKNDTLQSEYIIKTDASTAKIEFRNTAFVLKFKMMHKAPSPKTVGKSIFDIDREDKFTTEEIETTGSYVNTSSNGNVLEDEAPDDNAPSTPYIIALGCGGLLIIVVIIIALVFVKKRRVRRTSRKTKNGNFSRQSSTKYSHDVSAANTDVKRNPSIGSINNAIYDRVVRGQDAPMKSFTDENKSEKLSNNKNLSETKRKRLVELEDQYGPFLETAEYHQNSFTVPPTNELFRRDTRPMQSPPREATCRVTSICERGIASPNLYESIVEMQAAIRPAPQYDPTRASYITFTSDEFSDCEEGSNDEHLRDCKYITAPDSQVVSYDKVDDVSGIGDDRCHKANKITTKPPRIEVQHAQCSVTGPIPQSSPFTSRPSLSDVSNEYLDLNSQKSCSIESLLQEDRQHYLQPRPSCPDAVIACAYSSTEDLVEIRQRLLAAAHPSLLQNINSTTSLSEIPSRIMYDSPRRSGDDISRSAAEHTKIAYATPRKHNHR